MNVGYQRLDPRLPVIQNADLDGKAVLVRFDHNVVKDGEIKDPYRIDRTFGTLYNIVERRFWLKRLPSPWFTPRCSPSHVGGVAFERDAFPRRD